MYVRHLGCIYAMRGNSVVEWKIVLIILIFHVAPSSIVWWDVFSSCKKDKNELNFFDRDFNFFDREDFNYLCKG